MKSISLKTLSLTAMLAGTMIAAPVQAGGDPALGKQKAGSCVLCHGNDSFPGMFFTLQLGGRDADKLAIKTAKYANGKILHPIMNLATIGMKENDIADVSAYYQSLGKPFMTIPFMSIKGDDDAQPAAAPAPTAPQAASQARQTLNY
jgi:cytochrome c553